MRQACFNRSVTAWRNEQACYFMLTACASSVKSTAGNRSVIFLAVYDLFTTACCNSVHNSIAAVLSQQDAADLFPTALLQFCHNSLQQIWRQSVAAMWRQAATCRANASDMRPVDDIPQQAGNRPAATCANLAVYYRVDTIVSTLWQCWTILLTTLNNVGSTTLFKAVFINPEQVVRFLLWTKNNLTTNQISYSSFDRTNLVPANGKQTAGNNKKNILKQKMTRPLKDWKLVSRLVWREKRGTVKL